MRWALISIIALCAYGWSDLVTWLGFWESVTACWLVVNFPFAVCLGRIVEAGTDDDS